jgi:CheY-like chemotaxis protein
MVRELLIVDDDEEDRELFALAVKSIAPKIQCHEAEDGEHALAYLATCKRHPDYIFLDLNMPKLNGMQILEKLKKDPALKKIPVVIYTTSKTKSDEQKTRKLGAVHFITKPEKLSELQKALSYIFDGKWQTAV